MATLDDIFGPEDKGRGVTLDDLYPTSQTGRTGAADNVRAQGSSLAQAARQSALPLAGQALGFGLGVATAPFTGPLAVPVTAFAEGALGATGEFLNQKLGITEPDEGQIALQGIIPGGTRLATSLLPFRKAMPPTTRGAELVNRIALPEARMRIDQLAGPSPAPLFQRVAQSGGGFSTGNTQQVLANEIADLTGGANAKELYGGTVKVLNNLKSKLDNSGGQLSPQQFQTELRDLGAALKGIEGNRPNDVEQRAIKNAFGALADSLDQVGAGASRDLIEARRLVKRQAVLSEIEESMTNAEKLLRGQGEHVQFNANAVLNDLKKNPFWNGKKGERNPAFTPQEKRDIESIFTMLNKLPALQPGAGVNAGSLRFWQRSASAGAGGSGAGLMSGGDPVITTIGAGVGAAVPTMVEFGRVLNIALRTQQGRDELLSMLKNPKATIPSITAALSGALTATQARPAFSAGPMSMPVPFSLEP